MSLKMAEDSEWESCECDTPVASVAVCQHPLNAVDSGNIYMYDTPESNLEIRKGNRRSYGKRQKGNDKRKRCAAQKSGTSFNNLSSK